MRYFKNAKEKFVKSSLILDTAGWPVGGHFGSVAQPCLTLWPTDRTTPGPLSSVSSRSLLKFMATDSAMVPDHLILSSSILLLPSMFPSTRVFSSESAFPIRWPKYLSFSFSISPSSEYKGLIILGLTGLTSLQSNRLSRVFSSTSLSKHQFFGAQPSLWFSFYNSMIHMWVLKLEMHSGPNEMSCMCKRCSGFQRQYKILVGLTNNTLYLIMCLSNIIWTWKFKNLFLISIPLVPFSFLTWLLYNM